MQMWRQYMRLDQEAAILFITARQKCIEVVTSTGANVAVRMTPTSPKVTEQDACSAAAVCHRSTSWWTASLRGRDVLCSTLSAWREQVQFYTAICQYRHIAWPINWRSRQFDLEQIKTYKLWLLYKLVLGDEPWYTGCFKKRNPDFNFAIFCVRVMHFL